MVVRKPITITQQQARQIWLAAQRLDVRAPFGAGPDAVAEAVAHLGYVQIDTISVIERCHHHILFTRIPEYRREDLHTALSDKKSIFEYWTHALSYIPTIDFKYFVAEMKTHQKNPTRGGGVAAPKDLRQVLKRIERDGPLAITDFKDEKLIDKKHLWSSKKPSKSALEAGFYSGQLVVSARQGMLKTYELTKRHFGWDTLPKPATERQNLDYQLDRALRSQGLVSLDSICHLRANLKSKTIDLIARRVRAKKLIEVDVEGAQGVRHWAMPEVLERTSPDGVEKGDALAHILSPFDPLIIQRKRTEMFFDYAHLFEAYVTPTKRQWGYFCLPVLVGDEIVAVLDLKTDRQAQKLLIQNWIWTDRGDPARHQAIIEAELDRFERFQLAKMAQERKNGA